MKIKKYFLILSFFLVCIIALAYGVSPQWFAHKFLSVDNLDLNFSHILRAIMCLYLGFGFFWLFSAFSKTYRNVAVLTILIFAAGLVVGRIISFFADGQPSPILLLYIFLEFAIVPVAYWVFRIPE